MLKRSRWVDLEWVSSAALVVPTPCCGADVWCCWRNPCCESLRQTTVRRYAVPSNVHDRLALVRRVRRCFPSGVMLLTRSSPQGGRKRPGVALAPWPGRIDEVVGRLGFEPRQSASKALDLPLVDRPASCSVLSACRLLVRRGAEGQTVSLATIVDQYGPRGKVSVRRATVPACWTRC